MSNLSAADRDYLESALRMSGGTVLRFTDRTFSELFNDYGINIDDEKYHVNGTSKANRLRTFWKLEDNSVVGRVLVELAGFIRNDDLAGIINKLGFSEQVKIIGEKLISMPQQQIGSLATQATITNNQINIEIRPEIYEHIKRYLERGDYFIAVSEAYKVVREKLREKTGKEKASEVFNLNAESIRYHSELFGETAEAGSPKSDFFRGVGYIHLAVQFLRNEKAHVPASDLDMNLAIHYLSLASLAYDLISRSDPE
jgi:uncharacterized protein (TIGR02391 family)